MTVTTIHSTAVYDVRPRRLAETERRFGTSVTIYSNFNMEEVVSFTETRVNFYQITRYHNPESDNNKTDFMFMVPCIVIYSMK